MLLKLILTLNKKSYQIQNLPKLEDSNIFITPIGKDFIKSYRVKNNIKNVDLILEITKEFLEIRNSCCLMMLLNNNGKHIVPIIENISTQPFHEEPIYDPPKRILELVKYIPLGCQIDLEDIETIKKKQNLLDKKLFLTTDWEGEMYLNYKIEEPEESFNLRLENYKEQYNKQIEKIKTLNLEIKEKNKEIRSLIENYELFF